VSPPVGARPRMFLTRFLKLRPRFSVGRLNVAGTLLLAAVLFVSGQTSGGTLAFFTTVKSIGGNIFAMGSFDITPPHVVPPTNPADGATPVAINTSVLVTFSEPMNQSATQSAFALRPCADSSCLSAGLGSPVLGSFTWLGSIPT